MNNMKANRKFIEGEEAVSAVIGVILMVAITVAISATVYVYVSGMLGGGVQSTPAVSMTNAASKENCTVTIGTPTATNIEWANVWYTLVDNTDAKQIYWCGAGLGDTTHCTITLPSSGVVTGGQIITIKFGDTAAPWDYAIPLVDNHQYRFTLVYNTTGGTMGTVTWSQ